jgi:hypothetical protein
MFIVFNVRSVLILKAKIYTIFPSQPDQKNLLFLVQFLLTLQFFKMQIDKTFLNEKSPGLIYLF